MNILDYQSTFFGGSLCGCYHFRIYFATPVSAKDPIKIGFGMALTGGLAGGGKQSLVGMEMWADDINAKGWNTRSTSRSS